MSRNWHREEVTLVNAAGGSFRVEAIKDATWAGYYVPAHQYQRAVDAIGVDIDRVSSEGHTLSYLVDHEDRYCLAVYLKGR